MSYPFVEDRRAEMSSNFRDALPNIGHRTLHCVGPFVRTRHRLLLTMDEVGTDLE